MADNTNLARLKTAYQIWHDTKGESDRALHAWLDLFDDHIRIVSMDEGSTGLAFAKNRQSKEGAADYIMAILKEWKMVHFTPESFVTDGDQVAMFGRCCWTHRQTQNTAECHIAHLWTFNNGKVTNFTEVFDSARAAAAAMR